MEDLAILVLAAGRGRRMNSDQAKVLAQTPEGSLIDLVLGTASTLKPKEVVVVVGHEAESVQSEVQNLKLPSVKFALQETINGTGGAAQAALPELADFLGSILILCGDVPLLRAETLQAMRELHEQEKATLTLLTTRLLQPAAYGRILRNEESGQVDAIIEARDCSPLQLLIDEINTGVYIVDSAFLAPALESLASNNAQSELYLTDIVAKAATEGQTVAALQCSDSEEVLGVNTERELRRIIEIQNERRVEAALQNGAIIEDPKSCFLDPEVQIAAGAVVGPNVQLRGRCVIGAEAVLEGTCLLRDCQVGPKALVKFGVRAEGAIIGDETMIGPFAHLREGTELGKKVKVGNFVETKKAKLADEAKASHLTYLGDCEVGKDANIGAGTITCNYDGYKKSKTEIGAGAFIGSNSSLVAPVKVGKGAVVGAGSTITKEVSQDALAVTRADQREIRDWARKRRAKQSK